MPKLSVVVPFYNVESYIHAALESIAMQTLRDLEVIMVDDGSTDGSAAIAEEYAARDARFRLVHQQNQGLGPARNTGARHATGTYLAFADSDDLLDPHAYELLTGSMDKTGSDIASGGVKRISQEGVIPSWFHTEPLSETVVRTHVSKRPSLLQDRTAWNKVFRRSFWDSCGFEFPGTLYEDGPVMVRAHVLASSVDIFKNVVYFWRVRDSGEFSITQRARELSNIEDRMTSVRSIGGFLAERAPALKPVYDKSVLEMDLDMLVGAYELASEQDRARLAELAADYLRTVDESVYRDVQAIRRLRYYLLRHGMRDELLDVLKYWRRGDGAAAAVVRRGGRRATWYIRYPFFGDTERGVPDEVYDVTHEMTLNARLDAVTWCDGKLRIEGHAYVRRLSSATPSECRIRVRLRNVRTRRTIRLRAERNHRPDVTARSNQAAACYDWSGFTVEINPRKLATLGPIWRGANWELRVEVSGHGMRREGPVGSFAPGTAQWPEGRWVTDGVWVQPTPEEGGRFFIRGRRLCAVATACRATGDALEIEGWTTLSLASGPALIISPRKGAANTVRVPVEATTAGAGTTGRDSRDGRTGFRARVSAAAVISSARRASPIDQVTHVHDEIAWDFWLDPGAGHARVRLASALEAPGARLARTGREITAIVTPYGSLSVVERTLRPVVSGLEWTTMGHLILRGDLTDPGSNPPELVLRHARTGEQHLLPASWHGCAFTADLAPNDMPGLAGRLPLASDNWNLLARTSQGSVTVALARHLLAGLPAHRRVGIHEIAPQAYRVDALRLNVRMARAVDEFGYYAQRRLQERHYPAAMARPLREVAVFDSFNGAQYSCNPRAIYEELRRSHPEVECVWVTEDGQFAVPDGGKVVPAGSCAYYETLAQARYVVANNLLPPWYRKRPGQICLQTWHGTPLKRIGLDLESPHFSNAVIYPDLLRENARCWDVLLSPNAFSTPIFRRALGHDGEVQEIGSPRNDVLRRPGRDELAAEIRQRLGLPAGKRLVLYAPTWRDDAFQPNGRYRFQLQLDLDAVSRSLGAYHMLLRLHPNLRKGMRTAVAGGGAVTDVSRYPDIADLYLISDVLITDYSSALFDFACTGRPMLFFTYDLVRYRDKLRGFYFDFESEAPGPLLGTTAQVIEALRDIDDVERSYRQVYEAFTATYCALEDGKAAARAVDRLLSGR